MACSALISAFSFLIFCFLVGGSSESATAFPSLFSSLSSSSSSDDNSKSETSSSLSSALPIFALPFSGSCSCSSSSLSSSLSEILISLSDSTSIQSPSISLASSSSSTSQLASSSSSSLLSKPCSFFHLANNSIPGIEVTLFSTPYWGKPLFSPFCNSMLATLPRSFFNNISGATSRYKEINDLAAIITALDFEPLYSVKSCNNGASIANGALANISLMVFIPADATSAATPSLTNSSAIFLTTIWIDSGGTKSCDAWAAAAIIWVTFLCFGVRYFKKNVYTPNTISLCVPINLEIKFINKIFWSKSNLLEFLLLKWLSNICSAKPWGSLNKWMAEKFK